MTDNLIKAFEKVISDIETAEELTKYFIETTDGKKIPEAVLTQMIKLFAKRAGELRQKKESGFWYSELSSLNEFYSPEYIKKCQTLEHEFKGAVAEANKIWCKDIIRFGEDCGYWDSEDTKILLDAATFNIEHGQDNNEGIELLCRTGIEDLDYMFQDFIEQEAGEFDSHLDFFLHNFICYTNNEWEYFDTYNNKFEGDLDSIECIIGIDYASGAQIVWVKDEDPKDDLESLLNI